MKSLIELKQVQGVLQVLRLMAHGRQAGKSVDIAATRDADKTDAILHRLDAGLHPLCETCGRRIGFEELCESPLATQCRQCTV